MFYEMARRYDEWPGEDYDGSSARGAMKGWHKHGVCSERLWPYRAVSRKGDLTPNRIADAQQRPLGAYFRVNHRDLVAMHSAISEAGILYATSSVHSGWDSVPSSGVISWQKDVTGGHAFALIGYDRRGFWIQNSWGRDWGLNGLALVTYDDWLTNGSDVWVARLGVPIQLNSAEGLAVARGDRATRAQSYSFADLRPHLVTVGNDGLLCTSGQFANTEQEVRDIFSHSLPEITRQWKKNRILLYAHGGLVDADAAAQRVADYRSALLDAEVYPLAFIWKTDYWTTLTNMLKDALSRRRPEGLLDPAKDFMFDRLDDALEPLARVLTGKAEWDEMKENALLATTQAKGGARFVADQLAALSNSKDIEIHVVAHSAGSIFHAPLIQYLTASLKLVVKTCTLWAPACHMDLFDQYYGPAVEKGQIAHLGIFALSDSVERDDNCGNIYHKSLLYLVSDAFEAKPRIPLFRDGEPILGMKKFLDNPAYNKRWMNLVRAGNADLVVAPNSQPAGSPNGSRARAHGAFDDDEATVKATLARVLGQEINTQQFNFVQSAKSTRHQRHLMDGEEG
jgi:hypothetical protein